MISAVKSGFGGLLRFSGRDARPTFWFYFLAVFVLYMTISMVASVPMMNAMFAGEAGPDFTSFFIMTAIGMATVVCLLAAAVTRRLHDTGLGGSWGLLPLPFAACGLFAFPRLVDSMAGEFDLALFSFVFVNNMLYLIAVAILIVMLVRRGTPAANRFGEPAAV